MATISQQVFPDPTKLFASGNDRKHRLRLDPPFSLYNGVTHHSVFPILFRIIFVYSHTLSIALNTLESINSLIPLSPLFDFIGTSRVVFQATTCLLTATVVAKN